jgi:hypothetical protein
MPPFARATHLAALAAGLLVIGCTRGPRSTEPADGGGTSPSIVPTAMKDIAPAPLRAWPAPLPGSGSTVGAPLAPSAPLTLVTGDAARRAVPDRCPDHDECERIANNAADVAHASCDAECDRCCPHESADSCMTSACSGACQRCADATCRAAICNDIWLDGCRDRCRAEASACAGCRSVWCADGAAQKACHLDVASHHEATKRACARDCPAAEKRADGSCKITCGAAKKTSCARAAKDCKLGQSPDCRCECTGAVGGGCVAWDAVCVCD